MTEIKSKIYIKQKSIDSFLKERLLNQGNRNFRHVHDDSFNPYQALQDEIYLKDIDGLEKEDRVNIEVIDGTINTGKSLRHHYIYVVDRYDDVAVVVLCLESFWVTYHEDDQKISV